MKLSNPALRHELARLVKQALQAPSHTDEDKRSIEQILATIVDLLRPFLTDASPKEYLGTATATGVALDPMGAINCFVSYRTVVFWRGILAAIEDQQKHRSHHPIQVVDLGCGPLAGLTLPLATQLSSNTIKITLVDIHHSSITSVNRLINELGLQNYFEQPQQHNATRYRHPTDKPLHIAISETMYQALEKEGQVAIFHNIANQLTTNGVLIPEKISVNLAWLNPLQELSKINNKPTDFSLMAIKKERHFSSPVFELSLQSIPEHKRQLNKTKDEQTILSPVFQIPCSQHQNIGPFLTTTIQVYDRHIIDEYENGLTYPKALALELPNNKSHWMQCNFIIDSSPRFSIVTL